MTIYLNQTDTNDKSKISNAPENDSFAVSFIHFVLRREHQEDYMKVGESKAGIAL